MKMPRDQIAALIKEEDLLAMVIDLAHLKGWLVSHFRPAWSSKGYRTPVQGDKGFPDLVLVKGKRLLFVELKSEKGKLWLEQENWRQVLSGVKGVKYYLWRPVDWLAGKIEKELK